MLYKTNEKNQNKKIHMEFLHVSGLVHVCIQDGNGFWKEIVLFVLDLVHL